MSTKVPSIKLKIDPQDLQIQTFTVEKLLEPLIIQVTTLVNCPQNPSSKKKGRSKRARVLLASVEEATWNLLDKGEKIAKEAIVFKEELHAALADVHKESQALKVSAEAFTSDPCYLPKRQAVVQAARSLLTAVTRLLILADMVDVAYLLEHLTVFQRTFESLRNVSSKSDLQKTYQKFRKDLENLDYLAYKRQQMAKIWSFGVHAESHILEDVNKCIIALREQNVDNLDRAAGAIRARASRIAHIVSGEMDNYEPGAYTEGVMTNVQYLTKNVIPEFISQVNIALESLSKSTVHSFDDNQFVDISKKVYDTIHNIRCSVMMIRTPEELEDVSDLEEDHDARSRTSVQTEGKTDRAKMTQLPEAEKEKIAEQVADFKKVKSKLDAEIEIWDDTSNDIIVLAKRMCVIMMEMTDFTRGRGPLKNTSDVINAAKMISESGSRMDVLARLIANQCPDQSCKQDLLAYLEQIKLYSHQLKICSQVKAEIQNLGGELIMSALDSVTSLIQAAKNLMNAVVQTVKMSYIASTKIIKIQSPTGPRHPVVMWRMKAPEKKPLIKREKPEEIYAAVRKGSAKKRIHPVQVMSEFRGREIV